MVRVTVRRGSEEETCWAFVHVYRLSASVLSRKKSNTVISKK